MPEKIFNQLKGMWHFINQNVNRIDYDIDFIHSKFPFLNIATDNETLVSIFNYTTLKSEYVTNNIEDILGYTSSDATNLGINHFIENIHPSHTSFLIIGTQYLMGLGCIETPYKWSEIKSSFCGIRYNHPDKGEIRLLWQQYFLDEESVAQPSHALFLVRDVTHLIKDDFYWFRFSTLDDKLITTYNQADELHNPDADIITRREKQILQLMLDGKIGKEIASELFISINTVNNHRQNMLNKLGAKDTTALLTLVKMCNLMN